MSQGSQGSQGSQESQGSSSSGTNPKVKYNRLQFYIILLTPLIIMGGSTLMYFSGAFLPGQQNSHGVLLDPVLSVEDFGLPEQQITGERQWQLIQFSPNCDSVCIDKLHEQRQIHKALGKLEPRIDRVLLTENVDISELETQYPRLDIHQLDLSVISKKLSLRIPTSVLEMNPIFVVDPFGNIMLYFTPEHDYKDQMSDIKKLLKLSTIG